MSNVFSIGDPRHDGVTGYGLPTPIGDGLDDEVTGLRGYAGTVWSRADCGGLLARAEAYLRSYLSFPDDRYLLPLSLFAVLEHCWQRCFDEVPYLCVSAAIKRSGKTRLLELLAFLAADDNAIVVDGSTTVAALYTVVDQGIVVLMDEAEGLLNPRSPFRPILNGGYRRGQTLIRKIGGQNVYFSIFGPKVFAVIGDVDDSLRDRCIIVEMQRTQSETRMEYVRQIAKEQGTEIAGEISRAVASATGDIRDAYLNYHERYRSMNFLFDREHELWKPLFAICQIFAPERIEELERCAADIAALKTSPIRRLESLKSEEENAQKLEYAKRLLSDALSVIGERDRITTTDLLAGLRAIHTAPWRSYERSGLTEMSLAALLDLFHVRPKTIRVKPKSEPKSTAKGYLRTDVARLLPDPDPPDQMRSSQELFTIINSDENDLEEIGDEQTGDSDNTPSLGLPGCSCIYGPRGQALEYGPLACNPYRGCGCKCRYCYVPRDPFLKMTRAEFDAGAKPKKDFLNRLAKDAAKYQAAGITEQVFFSFTTDVYNPFDTSLTRPSLKIVQEHGMGICVLTKGGTRALADIDLYRPERDCFASTLTSLNKSFQQKWEPDAASPDDRIAALKAFHEKGIFTWVSLEPTIDVGSSLAIVEATHEFVDLYKVGRANYLKEITRTTNWEEYTHRMIDLCQRLGMKHYIKKDLQEYLPAGYHNPLRIPQHN